MRSLGAKRDFVKRSAHVKTQLFEELPQSNKVKAKN